MWVKRDEHIEKDILEMNVTDGYLCSNYTTMTVGCGGKLDYVLDMKTITLNRRLMVLHSG